MPKDSLLRTGLFFFLFVSFSGFVLAQTNDLMTDQEIESNVGVLGRFANFLDTNTLTVVSNMEDGFRRTFAVAFENDPIASKEREILKRASESEVLERKDHRIIAELARGKLEREISDIDNLRQRLQTNTDRERLRDMLIRVHTHLKRLSDRIAFDDNEANDNSIDGIGKATDTIRRKIDEIDRDIPQEKRINVLKAIEKEELIAKYKTMLDKFHRVSSYIESSDRLMRENAFNALKDDIALAMKSFEEAIQKDQFDIAKDNLKKLDVLFGNLIDMIKQEHPEREREVNTIVVYKKENDMRRVVYDDVKKQYGIIGDKISIGNRGISGRY